MSKSFVACVIVSVIDQSEFRDKVYIKDVFVTM